MPVYNSLPDEELVALLKAGKEAAFKEIYNRYWDKLYYMAHQRLQSAENAEEVVQDVFLTIWRKKALLNIQSLSVYLSAMVRYAVYKFFAKQKKLTQYEEDYRLNYTEYADWSTSMENKLLLEIITEFSSRLPEKCRLVFYYNKLQDRSLAEVAESLNITQKTAEAHLTKALKVIRGSLSNAFHIFF